MTFFYQPFSPNDVDFFPLVFTTLYNHSVEKIVTSKHYTVYNKSQHTYNHKSSVSLLYTYMYVQLKRFYTQMVKIHNFKNLTLV